MSLLCNKDAEIVEKDRINFYFKGFKICPKCNKSQFSRFTDVKGTNVYCFHFGKDCYTCLCCRWSAEYLFDKAVKDYYYEAHTLNWVNPFKSEPDINSQNSVVTLRLLKRELNRNDRTHNGRIKVKYVPANSSADASLRKKRQINEDDNARLLRRPRTGATNCKN